MASYSLLRPLLIFHFEHTLPIFYMHTRTHDIHKASLFAAALMQPRGSTALMSACMLHLRMEAAVLGGQGKRVDESLQIAHYRNAATVLVWSLLFFLSPEPSFRKVSQPRLAPFGWRPH